MRWMALAVFFLAGWKTEGERPLWDKCVAIAAPHTSNWDFLYTVCLAFIYRIDPRIMMKSDWFFWPMGPVLRWLGAIPIDRSKSNNVVALSVAAFENKDRLFLVVPPAGTRKKVAYWKSGFYRIAHGAQVPIVLGFLDYGRKAGGFGPSVFPSGDLEADMANIRRFYGPISGKNPLQTSGSRLASETEPPLR